MDVFELRERVVDQYARYVRSFMTIRNPETRRWVEGYLASGALWPEPLVQLNPPFKRGRTIDEEAGRPLTVREITDRALAAGLLTTRGKTPAATMAAQLYVATQNRPDFPIERIAEAGDQRARRGSVRWRLRAPPSPHT